MGINQSPALKDRTYEESRIQEMARKTLLWIESFLLQKQENRATPQLPSLAFSNRPSKCKKIALQLKRNRNEPLTMPCTTKINASFATASLQAFKAVYQTQLGLLVCHKKPHSLLKSTCAIRQLQRLFNCTSSNERKTPLSNLFNHDFPPFKFAQYKK